MAKTLPHSPSSKTRFSLAAGNSQANLFPALQISGAVQPAVDVSPWGVEAPRCPGPGGSGGVQLGAERGGEGARQLPEKVNAGRGAKKKKKKKK